MSINKFLLISFLTFFGIFGVAGRSEAAGDIYVSTVGTNSLSCGTIGSPCRNIQYAITNRITDANGGWNIVLRGGTYQEHDINIPRAKTGTFGSWNSLQSYFGEWAVIDGQRSNTGNTQALIENLDGFYHTESAVAATGGAAAYWKFERLELTGGGTTASGEKTAMAIWWVKGSMTVKNCYIHDNLALDATGNSAGVGGPGWQGVTIKYNYFDHNGSEQHGINGDPGGCNTTSGPAPESAWEYNDYTVAGSIFTRDNDIAYNYVKTYGDVGIRTKASARLTATRDGTDTARESEGDVIHHNIIVNQATDEICPALFYQQDYVQIYKNIIDMTGGVGGNESWPIATRRIRTTGVDILKPVIYNNTIYNGTDSLYDGHDGTDGTAAFFWSYNNIFDNVSNTTFAPIAYGCSAGYCPDYNHAVISNANLNIDRNYIYRTPGTDAIYIGNQAWPNGLYDVAGWESEKGVNLFRQAYDAGNLLYQGISGADKYRTRAVHTTEGSMTVADGGVGGSHPYLAGVSIPSYLGAANPSDDSWVSGVLGLATISNLQNGESGDPSWTEGSGAQIDTIPPSAPSGLNID